MLVHHINHLQGSYPNVDNQEDYDYFVENPDKALWWTKDKRYNLFSALLKRLGQY